jgi:hypothetical protein
MVDTYGKAGKLVKCISNKLYYGFKLTVGKIYKIKETKLGNANGKQIPIAYIVGDDHGDWWVALDSFDSDDDIKSGALWTTV